MLNIEYWRLLFSLKSAGVLCALCFICFNGFAQTTIVADTVITKKTVADSSALKHSPKKASLYSALLPGLGQAYNKKYWKIPVLYAAGGLMGYFIIDNNKQFKTYKKAYLLRLDGDSSTTDEFTDSYTDEDLRLLKNFYRRNRDLSYIVAGMIYVLNIVDAAVDAHLFYFNVSDDLSLKISPAICPIPNNYFAGLNLRLNINK